MKLYPFMFIALSLLGCDRATSETTAQTAPISGKGAMPDVEIDHRELEGTVAERLPAGHYTYLSVHTEGGPQWVVTLGEGEAVGTEVTVKSFGLRRAFRSRRLDRTFDELRFGVVRPAT